MKTVLENQKGSELDKESIFPQLINKLNFVNIVQLVFIYSLENRYK